MAMTPVSNTSFVTCFSFSHIDLYFLLPGGVFYMPVGRTKHTFCAATTGNAKGFKVCCSLTNNDSADENRNLKVI